MPRPNAAITSIGVVNGIVLWLAPGAHHAGHCMLDDVFTYSGELFSLAAFGAWLWLGMRAFPGLDILVAR